MLAAASPPESLPGQLFIQREGERLTVDAREVPQQQLLEALAQWLDFELILTGPLPQPRFLQIEGWPWEQALKQELYPASWAFRYARASGQDRLVQVVVFPPEPRLAAERHEGHRTGASSQPQSAEVVPLEVRRVDDTAQAYGASRAHQGGGDRRERGLNAAIN
jgi:hypothetical protein